MKQVQVRPEGISLDEVPRPEVKAGEALIRMEVVGVCGSDVHAAAGKHPFVPLPYLPGHEVVGVVEQTADDVTNLRIGDRVTVEPTLCCWTCKMCRSGRENLCEKLEFFGCGYRQGGMADYFTVPATRVHVLPEAISPTDAVLIEPLSTPVHAVRLAGGVEDKAIVIMGAGTIGLLLLAVARHEEARAIIMVDPLPSKRTKALTMGAHAVFDSNEADLVTKIRSALGESADVVFDCVANQTTISQAVQMAIKGGTVVVVGVPVSDVTIPLPQVQDLQVRLQGSATYTREDVSASLELIKIGKVRSRDFITAQFPLAKAELAFAEAATGKHTKVVLTAS